MRVHVSACPSVRSLDPGLLVVQVPEELVQAVGLVELGAPARRHALDLGEAAVDGVALVLHHRGVEGDAAHQAVRLAVQVLQPVLGGRAGVGGRGWVSLELGESILFIMDHECRDAR